MSDIPNSLKSRIAKLVALARDDRGNEHEAASASAKVQALLAEYNLEMSQVLADAPVDPDAVRTKTENELVTETQWQRKLVDAIADCNFCMRIGQWDKDADRRTYTFIGRKVNVSVTLSIYAYLTATIERLNPFADRRTKAHRSWKEGCADRLAERLYQQKWESEAQSRKDAAPRGDGSSLVLSDVYSSEDDLNRDLYYGYEPGTTARENAANKARRAAEREARRNAPVVAEPERVETAAERRKREAADVRWRRQYDRARAKEAARIDADAYAMGANAGAQISLDRQIGGVAPVAGLI